MVRSRRREKYDTPEPLSDAARGWGMDDVELHATVRPAVVDEVPGIARRRGGSASAGGQRGGRFGVLRHRGSGARLRSDRERERPSCQIR